jgi:hypothetical protein
MRVRRGLWCAAVVLLSSGCGLFSAQADAPEPSTPSSSTAAPTASAAPTTPPAGVTAALVDSAGRPARLSVTAETVMPGVPPLLSPEGTDGDACGLTDDTAEYTEVTVVFTVPDEATKEDPVTANLRVDLTVPDGDGVFLETDDPSAECAGGAGLPATATLQTLYLAAEHQTITVYVVARTGGLQGASLRLDDLRYHPDSTGGQARTWTVRQVTGGATCDGDPNSLCVPLA